MPVFSCLKVKFTNLVNSGPIWNRRGFSRVGATYGPVVQWPLIIGFCFGPSPHLGMNDDDDGEKNCKKCQNC